MIIAIDFDGTIVEHKYPYVGKLKKDAKETINKLHNEGHYIIIWTCRYIKSTLLEVEHFLKREKIQYHKINENCEFINFKPYPKIYADIYIDDRQIGGLPSWDEIYNIIKKNGGLN